MSIAPSSSFVKKSLNSHSSMGLFVGALLYFICLTGTLAVFYEEFERWEQPTISEDKDYSITQIEQSVTHFINRREKVPEEIYVVLPTEAMPRMHVADEEKEWFVKSDGSLTDPPKEGWTLMLKMLHGQLHLPQTIGLLIVGIVGVLFCGIIISGLFAHSRIFKDAFLFRRGGSTRLEQADLHNRLSVWGLPFHLMIGFTGAFIGLSSLFLLSSAFVFYDNNTQAVIETIYGDDPIVSAPISQNNYQIAFDQLSVLSPTAKPIYLVLNNMQTENQYFEIAATLPGRLIYSEMYRFKPNGEYINHQGFSDGSPGRQIAYSVYRLHFGHFDSFWIKILYGIFGLALTIICATGINIWLSKRKYNDTMNDLWVATVWGLPTALTLSALMTLLGFNSLLFFSLGISLCIITSLIIKNETISRHLFLNLISALLLSLIALHIIKFGPVHNIFAIYTINSSLFILALCCRIYSKNKVLKLT